MKLAINAKRKNRQAGFLENGESAATPTQSMAALAASTGVGHGEELICQDYNNVLASLTALEADRDFLSLEKRIRIKSPNLFSILGVERREIRHSAMLAWLFNPRGTHGFGSAYLQCFLSILTKGDSDLADRLGYCNSSEISVYSFECQREWRHMDLLLFSADRKIVICIENKIDASESEHQLSDYVTEVEKSFPQSSGWLQRFLYLSPDGRNPSDKFRWRSLSYKVVLTALKRTMQTPAFKRCSRLTKFAVQQYKEIQEKRIVMNESVQREAFRLIQRHREAIEVLRQFWDDTLVLQQQAIQDWCKSRSERGEIISCRDNNMTYIRFQTKRSLKAFPNLGKTKGNWHNGVAACYEIENRRGKIRMKFSVSVIDMTSSMRQMVEAIPGKHKSIEKAKACCCLSSCSKTVDSDRYEIDEFKTYVEHLLDDLFQQMKSFDETLPLSESAS